MLVPFTLHKRDQPGPVTALLLPSERAAELLDLCARLRTEVPDLAREWPALPPLCAVPGGFLVKLGRPVSAVFPGTIRLRALSANLFVPAGADLVPALLDDEAAALVRARGLVFLPGGRVLAFDPGSLVNADSLLTLPRGPDRVWRGLPARPERPQRLAEIVLDLPDDTPGAVLESGGADIGVDEPRPSDAGPAGRTAGRAALGVGRGLVWLGGLLRWQKLAKIGASLVEGAVRMVPRLSESLMGRQEAALRELLRQFRTGDLEQALRRALPLSKSPGRGGQAAASANLPTHNLRYRLSDLLAGGEGPPSIWFTSDDLHAELTREYRRAAEAATARGDYRRAAFIYGRLLHEPRLAADVLARGGLHHDAAILYLEVIGDSLAAARAFEAAGEADRALQIYRQRGEHILAGDLLRRLGEEDEAVRHYALAADQLAAVHNHLAAGELMMTRARRPDLAIRYFTDGWAKRPHGSARACLLRLLTWHAEQDDRPAFLVLVAEAEAYYGPDNSAVLVGEFFNALARLADHVNLAPLRDDLRDRALCGLSGKLRRIAETEQRPGTAVSVLLGQSGAWKSALVSDADFALKAALKAKEVPRARPGPPCIRLPTANGSVSAVCAAVGSGRLFLGFSDGKVIGFDPTSRSTFTCYHEEPPGAIVSLATDPPGHGLIVCKYSPGGAETILVRLDCSGRVPRLCKSRSGPSAGSVWLTPIAESAGQSIVGLWEGNSLAVLWGDDLLPWGRTESERIHAPVARAALLFLSWDRSGEMPLPQAGGCLLVGSSAWCFESVGHRRGTLVPLGWRACKQLRGLCSPPQPSWLWRDAQHLELAGIDEEDAVCWTELDYSGPKPVALTASDAHRQYLAAALVRPGLVAGVTSEGVEWLRRDGRRLVIVSTTAAPLEKAVACAASLPAGELLIICRDGAIVCVPLPR